MGVYEVGFEKKEVEMIFTHESTTQDLNQMHEENARDSCLV